MRFLIGWLYCLLWYSSILAGYAGLFCPLLPILFVSNKWYRWCTDTLFTFWQYYPTVLLETLCGCDIQVTGDVINASETSLLVMNHRTRTDWNFLWPTVYHSTNGKGRFRHSTKFVLKDVIRHIPGPGWVMQLACFIYIKRDWCKDRLIIEKALTYFGDLRYKFSLMVFPEGTDLTAATKRHSDNYATVHSLPSYDFVLHPRTTGFVFLVGQLMETKTLDAIYDVTLAYPDLVPQDERILLRGDFPKRILVHLVRYPAHALPGNDHDLKCFLENLWLCKERNLGEFYDTGRFLQGNVLRIKNRRELLFALVFWTLLPLVVLYCFVIFSRFRILVVIHTVFVIFLNVFADGFQSFEIDWYNFKRRIFRRIF